MAGILSGFGNAASQAMQMPYQQFTGPRVAELSGLQRQSMGGFGSLLGDPNWSTAASTYGSLAKDGGGADWSAAKAAVTSDVTDAYNRATNGTRSSYNTPGNFGSARSNLAQDRNDTKLARGLSQGLGSIDAQANEAAQNRRLQAASGIGGLGTTYGNLLGSAAQIGNMQRGFDQQVIDANYGDWTRANDYPWEQLSRGADIFARLQGAAPRSTTTSGPGADPVAQGLGYYALANSIGGSGSSGRSGK